MNEAKSPDLDKAIADLDAKLHSVQSSANAAPSGNPGNGSINSTDQTKRTPGTVRVSVPGGKRQYIQSGKYKGLAAERKNKELRPDLAGGAGTESNFEPEKHQQVEVQLEAVLRGFVGMFYEGLAILKDNDAIRLKADELKFDEAALAYAESQMPVWLGENFGAISFWGSILTPLVSRLKYFKKDKSQNG